MRKDIGIMGFRHALGGNGLLYDNSFLIILEVDEKPEYSVHSSIHQPNLVVSQHFAECKVLAYFFRHFSVLYNCY